MKKQEQLFYLIKSLTPNEERMIRNSIIRKTNYLQLFDVIRNQSSYNINEIRELFKNTKFINQLHVRKNYLIKHILNCLRSDLNISSVNIMLNNLLTEIEILQQRELFDQCLFQIEKAEQLAKKFEKNNYLNLILNWKRKLLMQQKNIFENQDNLNAIISEEKEIVKLSMEELEFWDLTINQFNYFEKSEEEKNKFYGNPLLKKTRVPKQLRSTINYFHINYTNAITSNKLDEALKNLNKLLEVLEFNPSRISEEPSAYITTLNNKVSLLLNMKRYGEIPSILEHIRELPTIYNIKNKDKLSVRLNLRTYNIELEMLRDTKNYTDAEKLIIEVIEFLDKNSKSITNDYAVLFYYQFAYIYFMDGKLDNSLRWTNNLLQNDSSTIRNDIYTYSRFLNLMIHFELKNSIVLKYAVDATRNHLRKKRKLLDFEKVLLHFFSKISMSRNEEQKELFLHLKEKLFSKTEEKVRIDILDYIDFELWIEKKLNEL